MSAARAAYIGGAAGTSLVLAGHRFGIPVSGTMAHSYVMSFDREIDAFATFADSYPDGSAVLLLDTYDTVAGAYHAVELAKQGRRFRGVRLDSGDLVALSKVVRTILDDAGLDYVIVPLDSKSHLAGDRHPDRRAAAQIASAIVSRLRYDGMTLNHSATPRPGTNASSCSASREGRAAPYGT